MLGCTVRILMHRFVFGRLFDLTVGSCRVRATRRSLVRFVRISRMRAMGNHRFVSFGEQPGQNQR